MVGVLDTLPLSLTIYFVLCTVAIAAGHGLLRLVGLEATDHLSQVTRWLDQMLLHGLALSATSRHPMPHRPLVEAQRRDNRLGRTAVGEQRHHEGDGLR